MAYLNMKRRKVAKLFEYHKRVYCGDKLIVMLTLDWDIMAKRIALLPCDSNVGQEPGTPDCGNCLPCIVRETKPDTEWKNKRVSDCSDEWPCHNCFHGSSNCGYQEKMTRDGCIGHWKGGQSKRGIGRYEEGR